MTSWRHESAKFFVGFIAADEALHVTFGVNQQAAAEARVAAW